jgi:hypothetical protein
MNLITQGNGIVLFASESQGNERIFPSTFQFFFSACHQRSLENSINKRERRKTIEIFIGLFSRQASV